MKRLAKHFCKRLWRDGPKSLSVPLIALVLVVLINLLGGVRAMLLEQYRDMQANFPILVRVSDHSGSNTQQLNIREGFIELFTNPDHPLSLYDFTEDLALRRTLTIEEIGNKEEIENLNASLIGLTHLSALELEDGEDIEVVLNFFGDYIEDVFQSDASIFFISDNLLPYVAGDDTLDIIFSSNNPNVNMALRNSISKTLPIIGTVSGIGDNQIIAPFDTVTYLGALSDGGDIYSQLLHMTVANNRRLTPLKSMASNSFAAANVTFSIFPLSMTIYDSEFFEILEPLRQNIILVDVATPFILVISVAVGFLTSLLLTRRRMAEYAIMRSVGVHRHNIFFAALGEQALLCLIGAALGLGLVALTWDYVSFTRPLIFLLCYVLGAVFSAVRAAGTDVMAILRNKE